MSRAKFLLAIAVPLVLPLAVGPALAEKNQMRLVAEETAAPVPPEAKPADPPKAEEKPADPPKAEEKPADPPKAEQMPADPPKAEQMPADPPQPEEPPADPPKTDGETHEDPEAGAEEGEPGMEDMSLGEIPEITIVELTPEVARKAVDAFILVREKYKDSTFEEYETLQLYVEKAPDGRAFEADMKSFGFVKVDDWYNAVTTLGLAYSALAEDQSADIKQQIEELRADAELAQDMKDRLIKGLEATIPTENNRNVANALAADPNYAEKLKLLDAEE